MKQRHAKRGPQTGATVRRTKALNVLPKLPKPACPILLMRTNEAFNWVRLLPFPPGVTPTTQLTRRPARHSWARAAHCGTAATVATTSTAPDPICPIPNYPKPQHLAKWRWDHLCNCSPRGLFKTWPPTVAASRSDRAYKKNTGVYSVWHVGK